MELVVSFVIILILASLSIVGVLAYQDFADFKRQNSYAQTLFASAQQTITACSVRGGRWMSFWRFRIRPFFWIR